MPTLLTALLGLSWLAGLVLSVAAAVYCYRITRITGGFTAWWLLIVFTFLFAIRSLTAIAYGVLFSATAGTESSLSSTATFDVVVDLVMSILLFSAMLGLHRTFRRQLKPSGDTQAAPQQ